MFIYHIFSTHSLSPPRRASLKGLEVELLRVGLLHYDGPSNLQHISNEIASGRKHQLIVKHPIRNDA